MPICCHHNERLALSLLTNSEEGGGVLYQNKQWYFFSVEECIQREYIEDMDYTKGVATVSTSTDIKS